MESEQMDPQNVAALAVMAAQLKAVAEGSVRTEKQLEKLDAINLAVSELKVGLALKADSAALVAVDSKVNAWVGQMRGALFTASLFIGLVQTGIVGGAAYIITHLQSNETALAVIAQRVESMDKTLRAQQGGKARWEILLKRSL